MGAKGMSAVEKIVFGSNTYAVIKEVDCPALVIPDKVTFSSIKNIAIASDFEPLKNTGVFKALQPIVKDYNAEVTMFNVTEEMKKVGEIEKSFASSVANVIGITNIPITYYKHEDVIYGTKTYLQQHQTSMLALVNRRRNFLQDLFHISFTKQISFHAEVPLLVLHN